MLCPICHSGMVFDGEDCLDQCGFRLCLPARRFRCAKCAEDGHCTTVTVRTGESERDCPHPAASRDAGT